MRGSVQFLFIGHTVRDVRSFNRLASVCVLHNISWDSNIDHGFDFWRDIRNGDLVAPIAIIHLDIMSYSSLKKDKDYAEAAREELKASIKVLPETTRRVFLSNAMSTPDGMKNTAIDLKGDLLVTYSQMSTQEQIEQVFGRLIEKGALSEEELKERGKTIMFADGRREGHSVAPERELNDNGYKYRDSEYIQKAKKGKEN